jgi:signal transduction histidine kinase
VTRLGDASLTEATVGAPPSTVGEALAATTAEAAPRLLDARRDQAERTLGAVRVLVLLLLAFAALAYAPSLTPALNRVNVLVLAPMLCWAVAQFALFRRAGALPAWLMVANPLVDISAVTIIIGGYGLAQSGVLAAKAPMFFAYFVILAARPMTSSTRIAAATAVLAVVEYGALLAWFVDSGRLPVVGTPVAASAAPGVSLLDEGATLLLLAVAGAVATYATFWQERLAQDYSRAAQERAQLEAQLSRAQFESLKLQLHPHFLFNALNTITALINADAPAAERVVSELSDLLRLSLRSAPEPEVPLERELEVLEHYIGIQRVRFKDRLTVTFDVEPAARRALVPNLILQPLVENAIRHGIAPRAAPGRVAIAAHRAGPPGAAPDRLELRVRDDGVGAPCGVREGIGLGNARARLRSLYGSAHHFEAGSPPGGGFLVTIGIPLRLRARDGREGAS